jgi:putative endonuclease
MQCVYLLQSVRNPDKHYIGVTGDLQRRLSEHNRGESQYMRQHRPWNAVVAIHFADAAKAKSFERYLKGGSGHAFAKRHLW